MECYIEKRKISQAKKKKPTKKHTFSALYMESLAKNEREKMLNCLNCFVIRMHEYIYIYIYKFYIYLRPHPYFDLPSNPFPPLPFPSRHSRKC